MYAFRITCLALIFIFRLRFPPGVSIATILQRPRNGFLLEGLIDHRSCEISRGETFEIKSPEMPGNSSNFNIHHEVAYSFSLDSYIFNANICIEQKLLLYTECQSSFIPVSYWLRTYHVIVEKFYCLPGNVAKRWTLFLFTGK